MLCLIYHLKSTEAVRCHTDDAGTIEMSCVEMKCMVIATKQDSLTILL